ncbi:MAG: ferrous iron transport protein B [Planctomycetes bacterium]|nr:ferrous iron transport protein B [Planctomycetota bacterium]
MNITAIEEKPVMFLGNVSVGKTTLFNLLCKKTACVSNYPGTLVEIGRGYFSENGKNIMLIDTPGINNINPESEEEIISRNLLLLEQPQSIALIGDGKNLRRTLLLALQLSEYRLPILLNLNMMDEIAQRGIQINKELLSSMLGVDVTSTTATKEDGVFAFRRKLLNARVPHLLVKYNSEIESALERISGVLADSFHSIPADVKKSLRAIGTLLLSGDNGILNYIREKWGHEVSEQVSLIIKNTQKVFTRPLNLIISETRLRMVDEIAQKTQVVSTPRKTFWSERIGEWTRQVHTGIPIAVGMLFLMYLFVGCFGAQLLVGLVEGELFGHIIIPFLQKIVYGLPLFVQDAFIGKFGLISMGLTALIGIVVPVLATFFFAFGILEDLGYIPRLSILLDRILKKIGLHGKGIIPFILGINCVTTGILTTRILETKKEKFIATLLIVGLPCAPLFAVMLAIFASVSFWVPFVVFWIIIGLKIITGIIADKVIKGEQSDFIMEIPPIRLPDFKKVLIKSFSRTKDFVIEAFPYFIMAVFIAFLLDSIGLLALIEHLGAPVVRDILGLPAQATEMFIMSVMRREAGAAMLKHLFDSGGVGTIQLIVCILVMTFLIPCLNTLLVIAKQYGVKTCLIILGIMVPYAILVGAAVNWGSRLMGIH